VHFPEVNGCGYAGRRVVIVVRRRLALAARRRARRDPVLRIDNTTEPNSLNPLI